MFRKNFNLLFIATMFLFFTSACSMNKNENKENISIVTSTNVYADIVKSLAGNTVQVVSIINSPTQDPHSYEVNAQDRLAISKANMVIQNGGGYDVFMTSMLKDSSEDIAIITAVDFLEYSPDDNGNDEIHDVHDHDAHEYHEHDFNEHVWYNMKVMQKLAHAIFDQLVIINPESTELYIENMAIFDKNILQILSDISTIKDVHQDVEVAISEPLPMYLISDMGLINRTPEEFSNAIESGIEVPLLMQQYMLDIIKEKRVNLFFYNEQTSSVETDKLLTVAESSNVGIIRITETLPEGKNFINWISDIIVDVSENLSA